MIPREGKNENAFGKEFLSTGHRPHRIVGRKQRDGNRQAKKWTTTYLYILVLASSNYLEDIITYEKCLQ